jgi:enoyl-CoA hydratase
LVIKVEESGLISWIVIDREERANSLDYEHLMEIKRGLDEVCNLSKNTRVVVITGSGEKYFSAGIDLVEVEGLKDADEAAKLILEGIGGTIKSMLLCRKPVVAAANGSVYGLAVELLQASDLAYAVKEARISVPALKWGLIPPLTPLLPTFDKRLMELILTGRVLSAEEAKRLGLINEVVENVDELRKKVEEVAKKISSMDPNMISLIKEARYSLLWPIIYKGLLLMSISASRTETKSRIREGFLKRR